MVLLGVLVGVLLIGRAGAADWPMYRADAARSGYTPDQLPERLQVRWRYQATAPRPAWRSSVRITYDFAHQPIVADGVAIVGSTVDDSVVALDGVDGHVCWKFITGGPVRFAPAAWEDRVFVASDDGCLYALSRADGHLLWKHRGGASARLCLGNERMISRWPARGGPVVRGDTVYYTAGIWPSSGVYVYALDARTGQTVWVNDESGGLRMPQPHGGAEARSGVAPQGYLLATEDRLFVPTGRAVPASFLRDTGKFEYYRLQENGSIGGARAMVADRFVINGGCFLERETGKLAARAGRGVFSTCPDGVLQLTDSHLLYYQWKTREARDRKGNVVRYRGLQQARDVVLAEPAEAVRQAAEVAERLPALRGLFGTDIMFREADENVARQTGLERTLAQARPDVERLGGRVELFQAAAYERTCEVIGAGREAVCGTGPTVSIVDLQNGRVRWTAEVEGNAIGLAVADGMLLVATSTGSLLAFAEPAGGGRIGSDASTANSADAPSTDGEPARSVLAAAAEEILRASGVHEGYCLDIGCGDGQLARELVQRSQLQVIGIESDPEQVDRARQRLTQAGVYGSRVTILHATLTADLFPQYFADLIVSSAQIRDGGFVIDPQHVELIQRPCGGVSCLGQPDRFQVHRRGPLPGAGQWTHQNSSAANTLCSEDTLVRGPLESSWFRDGMLEIVDRHAQGPAPLYDQGMLVVEGVDAVCGLDAYNGRTRWVYPLKNILADWDGVHHDVGIGDVGSNFCLGDGAVFVRTGPSCLKLDLHTGEKLAEYRTPVRADATNANWGFVACVDGILFGTVLDDAHTVSPRYANIRLRTESVLFFACDAETGELLWKYKPQHSIRNNAIAIADGRVYLIDRPLGPTDRITRPEPNGKQGPLLAPGQHAGGTLLALTADSGRQLWQVEQDIWGTQLAVQSQAGVVLMYYQAVKHDFFKLPSEIGGRLAAFQADAGTRLWDCEAQYKTRPIINEDTIYAEGGAWNLRTGQPVPWEFQRSYGCGQIASSRYLMLFRSATLGYLDLSRGAGTENFGGIRPSCWFNAIPAGGLVLVPDGSSQCACSYQTRAWIALQPCPWGRFSTGHGTAG